MNIPTNLMYSKSHEWVEFTSETTARVGITDFAQNSLGGIVFISLPEKGDTVSFGEVLGDVESVKAVSEIFSPISGKVTSVNEELLDSPQNINEDPYAAWLVEISDITGRMELLDAAAYEALCDED